MTAPAPLGRNVNNNRIAKRAPSRHDGALPDLEVIALNNIGYNLGAEDFFVL